MKIIYNNKNFNINISNHSSVYNLIIKCLLKLNLSTKNIDDFYVIDLDGKILNYSNPINSKNTYQLKRKIKGGNPFNIGNSSFNCIFGSIIIAILSVVYYNFYLQKILINVPLEVQAQLDEYATIKSVQRMAGGAITDKVKTAGQKIGDFFANTFGDSENQICLCKFLGEMPDFVVKKNKSNISSVVSAAIFTSFIIFVCLPLFTNIISFKICQKPHFKSIAISLIYLAVPLLIAIFIPKLLNFIDGELMKNGKLPIFENFKLLMCNVFLVGVFAIYLILNRKGISGHTYFLILICLGIFALLNINFKVGNQMIGVKSFLADISYFISNFITNIGPVASPNYMPEPIKLSKNLKVNFNVNNVSECYERFNIIFDLLKAGIIFFITFGAYTTVYHNQITDPCANVTPIK